MTSDETPIDPPNLPIQANESPAPIGSGKAPGSRATQFQPGHAPSGGRPKGSMTRESLFRRLLEAKASEFYKAQQDGRVPDEILPQTIGEQLAAQLFINAMAGDTKAAALIKDSAFGKVSDKIEHTGKDGEKLEGLQVVFVGAKPDGAE